MLWLGVAGELDALHALHREAALELGDAEPRPYVPHVTLGRGRVTGAFDEAAKRLAGFSSARFEVRHLTLYDSAEGRFRVLHRAAFPGAC